MSDPAGIAAAAVRAHMLLAEAHQPLTMAPGDLRTLLARYQHRLQELADAVEPVTSVPCADADREAGVPFSLPAHRPGHYHIKVCDGVGPASADSCSSMEREMHTDRPGRPEADNGSDDPKPGSTHDIRSRLKGLPHGHPSSPYNDDGSHKPPVLRLQDIELAELSEDGPSAADGPALADASRTGEIA